MTPLQRRWLFGISFVAIASSLNASVPALRFEGVEAESGGKLKFTVSVQGDTAEEHTVTFTLFEKTRNTGQVLSDQAIFGPYAAAEQVWSGAEGVFRLKASVEDLYSASEAEISFEVFTDQRRIRNGQIASAVNRELQQRGRIVTSSKELLDDETEAPAIFWSGGAANLTLGFTAPAGTFFWAAIDQEADDEYDLDEDLGPEERSNEARRSSEPGSSTTGATNGLHEGAERRDRANIPASKKTRGNGSAATSPGGGPLVLKLPTGYLGINTSTFEASVASAP